MPQPAEMSAVPVLLGSESQWTVHGKLAKEAYARKDFLAAAMELEQCQALLPNCEKTEQMLARARKAARPQFWVALPETFSEAEFVQLSPTMFAHMTSELCVYIELLDPVESGRSLSQCLVITVDNYDDPEGLASLVALELKSKPDCKNLGMSLLKAIGDMVHMAGQEAEPQGGAIGGPLRGDDYEARALAKLPSPEELSLQIWGAGSGGTRKLAARPLHILTWGDAHLSERSDKLKAAKFHVNAKPLNGRGGGADTSENALEDGRIMLNVAESLADGRGLLMLKSTVRKIEEEDASCISIFCTKGRHRSVSMAMLIHKAYYPGGSVKHLTIT